VQRYDPSAELSDDIETEENRVVFIKEVAQLFASKARIKLNTRKL
jgi:clusterin-associated protein 1